MNSGKGATAEVVKKILSLLPGVDCGGYGGCGSRRKRKFVPCLQAGCS